MQKKFFYASIFGSILTSSFNSQAKVSSFNEGEKIDYKILEQDPKNVTTYLVDKIEFQGLKNLDEELVRKYINIKKKKALKIPSPAIRENIEKLLKCDFIEHVSCFVSFVDDIHINLIFKISEFPIIESYEFVGITKKKEDNLKDKITFFLKKPASNKYLTSLKSKITRFYVLEEGCRTPQIDFQFVPVDEEDPSKIILKIVLPEIKKTYVNEIHFLRNENVDEYFIKPELSLREKPKFTLFKDILLKVITLQPIRENGYLRTGYKKEDFFRYFKNNVIFIPRTKFNLDELKEDKKKILNVFSQHGYNDAEILKTKIKYYKDGAVDLDFFVDEGKKFYINSIKWTGNAKYETKYLSKKFNVKKGDVFSLAEIQKKILEPGGLLSLYQNFGYLKSHIEPIVTGLDGDKVDLEMRVYEGDVYKVNEVGVVGNTITFDEIIRRKLWVQPGEVYNKSDIEFSIQRLAMSNLFDAKNINPTIENINEKDKTVDVIFNIKKESPKFRLAGNVSSAPGDENNHIKFGASLSCNNVSITDMLKFRGFLGGGQNLNLAYYFYSLKKHSVNFSFENPYLTIEKYPWGYDFGVDLSIDNEDKEGDSDKQQALNEFSAGVGFSKQLPWENGAYNIYFKPNYKFYKFENYKMAPLRHDRYDGVSREITLSTSFIRDTQDDIFFPKKGSRLAFNFITTPPFGWFKKFDEKANLKERLKWRDFGLFILEGNFYYNIWDDLVVMVGGKHGQNFSYSDKLVTNKFSLGGGFANKIIPYGMLSLRNVPLRGYVDNQFKTETDEYGTYGGKFCDVFSAELRFLLFNLGIAKMYVLGFFDMGILYNKFEHFGTDNLKKSAGLGFRIALPMFGVLGFDWGYGIDRKTSDNWEFHFQMGV